MKKKILVRLSTDPSKIVLSFPFLMELYDLFPDEEVHIVVDEELAEILKFLSKKFLVHHLPKDKKSILGIHHFVVNTKDIFNVETFFDLGESFKSSFMGFNFRSKERFGFEAGLNKLLLNVKLEATEKQSYDVKCIQLLEKKLGKGVEQKKYRPKEYIEMVENITRVQNEADPNFLLFIFNAHEFDRNFPSLKKILEKLENVKVQFCFWGIEDDKFILDTEIRKDIESLPVKKPIERIVYGEYGQLIKQMCLCKGIITDIHWMALVSGFYGVNSLVLTNQDQDNFVPLSSALFAVNPTSLVASKEKHVLMEDQKTQDVSVEQVIDLVHSKFNI